jgi:hypothetical protein
MPPFTRKTRDNTSGFERERKSVRVLGFGGRERERDEAVGGDGGVEQDAEVGGGGGG